MGTSRCRLVRAAAAGLVAAAVTGATSGGAAGAGELAQAERPMAGHRLLALCQGIKADRPLAGSDRDLRCLAYVQGVVEALRSVKVGGTLYCPPPDVGLREIVLLYQSEAALYPDALDAPASDLITGMLLKFFPCRGDGGRGAHLGTVIVVTPAKAGVQ